MKSLLIVSLVLSCLLHAVHTSSESSSSSESSNDVSSAQSATGSESAACTALRTTLEQALEAGSLDVATLLADESLDLTLLNNRLNIFVQAIRNGDVTSEVAIERFLAMLSTSVLNVIADCDLDEIVRETNLASLLEVAFGSLLQDLTNGFLGCFVVEDFLQNDLILQADRDNFDAIISYLLNFTATVFVEPSVTFEQASVFNLSFHDANVVASFNLLQPPIFADVLELLTNTVAMRPTDLLENFTLDSVDFALTGQIAEFDENLNLRASELAFVDVVRDTCNIDLSDLELQAISNLRLPDFTASVSADVNCNFIEIVVGEVTRIGEFNDAIFNTLFAVPFAFYHNFAPTLTVFIGIRSNIINLPISDSVEQDIIINDFVSSFQRCVPELNDTFLSFVDEFIITLVNPMP